MLETFVYNYTRAAAISQETMTLHHSKHHNTYVTNLNAGLEKLDAAMTANDVSAIISLQGALKFNGTWLASDGGMQKVDASFIRVGFS